MSGFSGYRSKAGDPLAATYLPFRAHVSPSVVVTHAGDYLQSFELHGLAFETADDALLAQWHERLHGLWRSIASPELAVWVQLLRRPVEVHDPFGDDGGGEFSLRLRQALAQRVRARARWRHRTLLTLVYRPPMIGSQPGGGSRASRQRVLPEEHSRREREALEACEKLALQLRATLADMGVTPLVLWRENRVLRSGLLEAFAEIVNGEREALPLGRADLSELGVTSRIVFGRELIEQRSASATRLTAMLGFKSYPAFTAPGLLNRLLAVDLPLTVTQSFAFLSPAASQGLVSAQLNRLRNAGDRAQSQAEALTQAMDGLASGEFALGEHHCTVAVHAQIGEEIGDAVAEASSVASSAGAVRADFYQTVRSTVGDTGAALRRLQQRIALVRSRLAEAGIVSAREDLALEAAFWAQSPGNFLYRPRKAPISSRNFAGLAPLHDYPSGAPAQGHWGAPLVTLATRGGTPFAFSLHGDSDTGHSFVCGPTGSGKSVLLGTLITLLQRRAVSQCVFDKDRGLELTVRALGGRYLTLKVGEPTGLNPLQWPAGEPAVREFLGVWLRQLAAVPGRELSARQEADLEQALTGTLALPVAARSLSRLVEFLDPTDPDGVAGLLAPWCRASANAGAGAYGWAFDCAEGDPVGCESDGSDLSQAIIDAPLIAFDVTEFLDEPRLRTPLTMALFALIRRRLDGRPLVVWLDEFSRLLDDPAFAEFAKDGLKTWRKRNAVAVFATQSVSDVLRSTIARTLIEQTPTQIFFGNAQASSEELTQGLGLPERECAIVREELTRVVSGRGRPFLLRQGGRSSVVELDLTGASEVLSVLGGRMADVQRAARIRASLADSSGADVGDDPACWLPAFWAGFAAPAQVAQAAQSGSGAGSIGDSVNSQESIP